MKNKKDIKAKRYIVFDIITEEKLDQKELEESIRKAVKDLGGKIWLEIANPKVIMIYQNHGIISTNRSGYKIVIASLPLTRIENKHVLLVPRRTTGSLKRAKRLIGIK